MIPIRCRRAIEVALRSRDYAGAEENEENYGGGKQQLSKNI